MDVIKDIFFLFGSLLGILAFIRTVIQPALSNNLRKWEELKKIITEDDLMNIADSIDMAYSVDDELLLKLTRFAHDIEKDSEYLRFGPPLRKRYNRIKNDILNQYRELRQRIQVPFWDRYHNEAEGVTYEGWKIDKKYFYRQFGSDGSNKYANNLLELARIVDDIREKYRSISVLSNLHSFELLFAPFIVRKRSELPR